MTTNNQTTNTATYLNQAIAGLQIYLQSDFSSLSDDENEMLVNRLAITPDITCQEDISVCIETITEMLNLGENLDRAISASKILGVRLAYSQEEFGKLLYSQIGRVLRFSDEIVRELRVMLINLRDEGYETSLEGLQLLLDTHGTIYCNRINTITNDDPCIDLRELSLRCLEQNKSALGSLYENYIQVIERAYANMQ